MIMSNGTNREVKYRPSLTAKQIKHMLLLAKKDTSPDSLSVISILAPFEYKIANGAVTPAYITAQRVSIEEELGMTPPPTLSKEDYWSDCYAKYLSGPESCTLEEIQAAKEHMYLNDLMSEDQIAEHEGGIGA